MSPGAKWEPQNSDSLKGVRVTAGQVWEMGTVIPSKMESAQPQNRLWNRDSPKFTCLGHTPGVHRHRGTRRTERPLCHVWLSPAKPLRLPSTSLSLPEPGTAVTAQPSLPWPCHTSEVPRVSPAPVTIPIPQLSSAKPSAALGTALSAADLHNITSDVSPRISAEEQQSKTTNTLQVSNQATLCSAKIRTFLCPFWMRFLSQNFNKSRADSCHRKSQMNS